MIWTEGPDPVLGPSDGPVLGSLTPAVSDLGQLSVVSLQLLHAEPTAEAEAQGCLSDPDRFRLGTSSCSPSRQDSSAAQERIQQGAPPCNDETQSEAALGRAGPQGSCHQGFRLPVRKRPWSLCKAVEIEGPELRGWAVGQGLAWHLSTGT